MKYGTSIPLPTNKSTLYTWAV